MLLTGLGLVTPSAAQHASTRLSDELRNLPGMHSTTLDRFHTHLAGQGLGGALGLSGAMSGPTVVMLDGMPIGESFLGAVQWNALPVATVALDTLYARSGWVFFGDRMPSDGAIVVRTRHAEGWSARTSVMPVNETGDPGPDLFRSADARNVDRSGPAVESVVAYRKSDTFMEAGYRFDEHHMTDPAYADRVWNSYAEQDRPRVRIHAPWIRAHVDRSNLRIQSLATLTRIRDFRYVAALGREWPTREEEQSLTIQVERAAHGPWQSGMRISAHDRTVGSRSLRIAPPEPISVRTGRFAAWLSREWPGWSARLDAGAFAQDIRQAALSVPRTLTASTGLGIESPDGGISVRFWTEAVERRSSPAPSSPHSGAATAFVRPVRTTRHTLELRIGMQSRRPSVGTTFLEMHRAGVSFADFIPVADDTGILSDPGYSTRERIVDASVEWTWLAPDWRIRTTASVRESAGLTVPALARTHVERPSPVFRETHIRTGIDGRMATAAVQVDHRPAKDIWTTLSYRYTRRIADGSLPFWLAMEGLPMHIVDLHLNRRIRPRVAFRLFASLRAPHAWYQHRTFQSGDQWQRPWTLRTEATVTKQVVGDHGSVSFGILNLPDVDLRMHPEGANEQLAVRLRLDIRL
ncbi:MAG: hypothetical protein RIE53_06245 [Rhodothermales bacterium]